MVVNGQAPVHTCSQAHERGSASRSKLEGVECGDLSTCRRFLRGLVTRGALPKRTVCGNRSVARASFVPLAHQMGEGRVRVGFSDPRSPAIMGSHAAVPYPNSCPFTSIGRRSNRNV